MTKPLTFVVLALIFAIAGCASRQSEPMLGATSAAPSDGSGMYYGPWTVPIRFIE